MNANSISAKSFIQVATTLEFARSRCRIVCLRGKEIAIFKIDDAYYAIDNLCPHRQAPLSTGEIDKGAVVCPWHGARFELQSGKGLPGPHRCDIGSYAVRVEGDAVKIAL